MCAHFHVSYGIIRIAHFSELTEKKLKFQLISLEFSQADICTKLHLYVYIFIYTHTLTDACITFKSFFAYFINPYPVFFPS